jgi:hypothetical protein
MLRIDMVRMILAMYIAISCFSAGACEDLDASPIATDLGGGNYNFTIDCIWGTNPNIYLDEVQVIGPVGTLGGSIVYGTIVTVPQSGQPSVLSINYTFPSALSGVAADISFKFVLANNNIFSYNCLVELDDQITIPAPIPCPIATFSTIRESNWCNTGDVNIHWSFCNDVDGDGVEDNYWTAQYVEWNLGDGTTETTQGTSFVSHSYNTPSQVIITATAYFIGLNGELCTVPLIKILPTQSIPSPNNPCLLVLDPSMLYNEFLIIEEPYYANPGLYVQPSNLCENDLVSVYNSGQFSPPPVSFAGWTYELFIDGQSVQSGSGIPDNTNSIYQTNLAQGDYSFEIVYTYGASDSIPCSVSEAILVTVDACDLPCETCNSFKPLEDERYWISAWVKEDHSTQEKKYNNAFVELEFVGNGSTLNFHTSGDLIEGWQRIVGSFTIPQNTTDMNIHLVNDNPEVDAFFDDIRIHPFNASMKSYVYDPITYWLTAELDDNNYATFYEYDKEGQLIRIKKETARGIMTIQESRSSNPKEN